ncbi:hypothetical protein BU24DRAFT_420650 [Aaosphaeria arxii CBS 175.79]|uniref:N-acetyltransferase domain-containing protein n=1 Tax=Aaosphaeria arxii CBS 175.79 TaxID=1450172 RepID=A0A6A5XWS9_9PLEO|nr:uncharacterized protein BU24DRAFT_420650 [Aaosphaeria arxii CBS 175.79]KAF2017612.1 hypothetical protein BU24DRAFT_420650 [Aaosphaeria arxii CBS 175.79]
MADNGISTSALRKRSATMQNIDSVIETPRLILLRLTDTEEGSQHLQWFHEWWTDPVATSWSMHGACKSYEESREWMIDHVEKFDHLMYAIFEKPEISPSSSSTEAPTATKEINMNNPGKYIGKTGLRRQAISPVLPPPPPPSSHSSDASKPLNLRVIGYALFKSAWGKGYATEANTAMLETYAAYCAREKTGFLNYLEAGVDESNQGSRGVLGKLGFKPVGFKTEVEPVFLAGAWRHGGYWIYGRYI